MSRTTQRVTRGYSSQNPCRRTELLDAYARLAATGRLPVGPVRTGLRAILEAEDDIQVVGEAAETQSRNRMKRAAWTTAISTSWTTSTTTPLALVGQAGSEPHVRCRL
jgi:hypothetical protein